MDVVVFSRVRKLETMLTALDAKAGQTKISLVVGETAPLIGGAATTLSLDIGNGSDYLLIKSLYVEGAVGAKIEIALLSKVVAPFEVYKNAVDGSILYDVVDLPYRDEDGTGKLHITIKNRGLVTSAFKIRVAGIAAI